MRTESVAAPVAEIRKRAGVGKAASEVADARVDSVPPDHRSVSPGCQLPFDRPGEIAGMEEIADLRPTAAKPDVPERLPVAPGPNPIGDDPLIGLAKLPGAREHAATIDPHRKTEGIGVFQRDELRASLRDPVKRQRRNRRERFRDSPAAQAWRLPARPRCGSKRPVDCLDGKRGKRRDRVDPARAQKNEPRAVPLAKLEDAERADEIVIHDPERRHHATDPGQHARLGGTVEHPVDAADSREIVLATDVPLDDLHAETAKRLDVTPAAVAEEVVEADDLEPRKRCEQRGDQRRSDEAAGAGDKQPHRSLHPRTISVKMSSRLLSSRQWG